MTSIDPNQPATKIRALFISDLHFGYRGVDTAALLDCLKSYSPQRIYLVGDIIDGWKLSKRWFWTAGYTHVLDALVDHRRRGAKIIYLPGNHDERVRHINIIDRAKFSMQAGLKITNTAIHTTKLGKKLIVLHGDQFDNVLLRGRLSKLSDWFFETLTDFFDFVRPTPLVIVDGKPKKFSLAKALVKKSGKMAFRMLGTLERRVVRLIRNRQLDGLICGHTHLPKIKMLRRKYLFGNCGVWMGYTNTAIIETLDGTVELVRWPDMRATQTCIPASEAVHIARNYETALIIRRIRRLWPSRKGGVEEAKEATS
ncbi:MAG: UDP-2,3-diacylglucosamine diphosphatase [Alphaproteobacteria bacterium]|nr:UDP-2,3-diacylglucosamine diphosphatase [Alphaproteobacteria bacterium]